MSRFSASGHGLPPAPSVSAPSDRRFRRPARRPERRPRLLRLALAALRWLVPVTGVAVLTVWCGQRVVESQLFAVQDIVVRGSERVPAVELERLVDDMRGQNILQVNFETYRHRLLESPWVARVTLARILPSTIEIQVEEREPMAAARLGQQLYLVDYEGVIVAEAGGGGEAFDLPIVDGLVASPAASGPAVDPDRARLTGALLAALDARPDLRDRLSQIDVSNARDAVVMFDDEAIWLHLGEERFIERLGTYLELVPTLRERFRTIDYVDLRFDERVFVGARDRAAEIDRAIR